MPSNFDFLQPEFAELHDAARRAERYARTDARASAIYARLALETAVQWLYAHDSRLSLPYDTKLGALLHAVDFRTVVPEQFFHKAKAIQKAGNLAAHNPRRPVKPWEAQHVTRELFHALYWLARTYHRQPLATVGDFDTELIPRPEANAPPTANTAAVETLQAELTRKADALERREKEIDERLAELQAEVAAARARNSKEPDTHDYAEADTRRFLIDLELKRAGWDLEQKGTREYEVTGMPSKSGVGKVDYVLWGLDGKPLAVVEAKRTFQNVEAGQQQARLYADCLERMHGVRPFIYYTNGYAIQFWDDLDYPPRAVSGYRTREELELLRQRRDTRQTPSTKDINIAIVDRYYQKRAVGNITANFAEKHRRGLLVMATGTGKTRTAIALVDLLQRCHWVKRTLFLADRISLVNQATNAFKRHLPDSSPVNLCAEKEKEGRVYVSTYPTMMGLIDELDKGTARFGPGFFDLVIIDEAHRSVYQRYRAIFDYFDCLLVGLTATPREEVDRNTYELFELEAGVPTDAYELEEAVRDGFLVPPRALQANLRFPREGIRYDDLSEEEKRKWESMDWGEDAPIDAFPVGVEAAALNKWLFNADTVDKALAILMERGHRVEDGDRLAKTIVFARSHNHAAFIAERFDHHYPHLQGSFARVIDNTVKYAQSLIEAFEIRDQPPHIAISVDMMDTGIDVPEVANLVFFKPVYSKIKFWQMIGRGTRLSPNLYGENQDKQDFLIFDFCSNFEFFNEKPDGIESSAGPSMGQRLFVRRVKLVHLIDEEDGLNGIDGLRGTLVDQLRREVSAMPRQNFLVRRRLPTVERFSSEEAWARIDEDAAELLRREVAGLPTTLRAERVETKRFDLLCYGIELAVLEGNMPVVERGRRQVAAIAGNLETKPSVPAIREALAYIQAVQSSAFWKGITAQAVEELRMRLRSLAQFVDNRQGHKVYGDLEDAVLDIQETHTIRVPAMTSRQYEKKVSAYLKAHLDSIAVQKLRLNEPLTPQDLASLEATLVEIGAEDGKTLLVGLLEQREAPSLPYFVRTLVGLDRRTAQALFSEYLSDRTLSCEQVRFVEMLVDELAARGVIEPSALYENPFSDLHDGGPDGLFASRGEIVNGVFATLEELRSKLVSS